eukprot:TRINITY_DN11178_c0_g1_i3.p1 TRINITY_DN11178_c0_g1~~TRINITY_DN11178_c0_g1_i3.p1  ORF type:complete len:136 (-),score=5.21 TRINITY_DN11178_c0_g1_i3:26-433(-)
MDHHCPWIGNCVGIGNHKFFFQMLMYGSLFLLYHSVITFYLFHLRINEATRFYRPFDQLLITATALLALVFGLVLPVLCCVGISTAKKNLTYIETLNPELEKSNPFDRGSFGENLADLLGRPAVCWLCPTSPSRQ